MHILYLSFPGGGLDTNVRVLAPALNEAGHRASVLYLYNPGEKVSHAADEGGGYNVYHATISARHYYARRALLGLTSLPRIVRAFDQAHALARMVARIHKANPIDLIELAELFATPRHVHHLPYVVRLHASGWTCRRMFGENSPLFDAVEAFMETQTLRRARGISSPSKMLANYIRGACGLGSRQIEIIPYPVDTSEFAPNSARSQSPLVFYAGRVEKRKGADVLLRAMPRVWQKHPDCEFVFAGSIVPDLRAEAAVAAPRVKFLGARPRSELIGWYQRAALFVAPTRWDNSPNTIYEAMACGTPVVATRVGGIPELVEDGITGLLVPPGDVNALAEAILILLGDKAQREQMGARAREKALAQYSVEKILTRTLEFYARALGQ